MATAVARKNMELSTYHAPKHSSSSCGHFSAWKHAYVCYSGWLHSYITYCTSFQNNTIPDKSTS